MHNRQCHYQCQYSIGLAVIFSVHFQECSQGPWWDSFACLLSAPRRPKTHIPCMLRMLELTADPVQEATKVDNSAHLQSKSVICQSVHRPWCQQSMKYITVNSDGDSNSCGWWTVGHILRQKPELLKWRLACFLVGRTRIASNFSVIAIFLLLNWLSFFQFQLQFQLFFYFSVTVIVAVNWVILFQLFCHFSCSYS